MRCLRSSGSAGRWSGTPQPQDDRVDELIARKREIQKGGTTGASIEVWFRSEAVENVFESSENKI